MELQRPKLSDNNHNRFSDLPESVILHIFSFMDTIDVVRASAVATNWRYLWTKIPRLIFHYNRFCGTRNRDDMEFKDLINWVLMAHDKSVSIQSFRLSCLGDHWIYRWMNILAQKHVRQLHLEVTGLTETTPFVLPRYLIASDSLEILELRFHECDTVVKIPSHVGFSRLKSLTLEDTRLLDQVLFQNFISSCPLLETLILRQCQFHDFKVLDISLRDLRKLVISIPSDQGLSECEIKIACQKLEQFYFLGSLAKNISWDKNPSFLQAASIFAWVWDGDFVPNEEFADHVSKILRGVSHAEVLHLGMCILTYTYPAVSKPECLTTFYNLKVVAVSIRTFECYILPLIYLMKCAPNLERLSMLIDEYEEPASHYVLEIPDEAIECHLKRVKLIDVGYDNDNELELIRFFLENGHVLEEMSIISKNRLEPETKREYIQEVMRFPPSSSYVTVTFSEPKQDGWGELGVLDY
ncbi:hypothetical protein COLO4_30125 [Corchorus olitorius]|uniref:F-box domain-containing protein n=1 Tax=Corchorus olitorius TaxID=93759 RepID=A0A1R3HAV0_9ROSI|nr:hypothetical protein COLO4_30125 [Corchorus olitorius]